MLSWVAGLNSSIAPLPSVVSVYHSSLLSLTTSLASLAAARLGACVV